ncbi:hypothetical protein PIB30_023582 [Stylosanthes scabra]|uniref:Uncharacterized protein n=1 Tax=Stylosanthes scabra TaxID=79078 RepID=A0ABU6X8F8_9FABA|nr:hypothetical protein [Stylosanthes scabra]
MTLFPFTRNASCHITPSSHSKITSCPKPLELHAINSSLVSSPSSKQRELCQQKIDHGSGSFTAIVTIAIEYVYFRFIEIEKSMRKAKKNIGSKDGLETCKSGYFTKKQE